METGQIKRVTDRGFGFIGSDAAERDLFFHASAVVDVEFNELKEGDPVTFDIIDGEKGPAATNVQRAGGAAPAAGASDDADDADDAEDDAE